MWGITIGLHLLTITRQNQNQTKGLDVVEPKNTGKFSKNVIHFEKLKLSLEY